MKRLFHFEHQSQPLAPRAVFTARLAHNGTWAAGMVVVWLAVGMAGYMLLANMNLIDAFLNASMILSGMGPVGELTGTAAKLFAGTYAILSGLLIFGIAGIALAPLFHRIMHKLNLQDEGG